MDAVNVEPEKLTELVKPAGVLGYISKEASQSTGMPEGLPLIATAADKATEVIGAGCVNLTWVVLAMEPPPPSIPLTTNTSK